MNVSWCLYDSCESFRNVRQYEPFWFLICWLQQQWIIQLAPDSSPALHLVRWRMELPGDGPRAPAFKSTGIHWELQHIRAPTGDWVRRGWGAHGGRWEMNADSKLCAVYSSLEVWTISNTFYLQQSFRKSWSGFVFFYHLNRSSQNCSAASICVLCLLLCSTSGPWTLASHENINISWILHGV